MALFSRRKKPDARVDETRADGVAAVVGSTASAAAAVDTAAEDAAAASVLQGSDASSSAEPTPHVPISVSTFGSSENPAPPAVVAHAPAAESAPQNAEVVPGLHDNVLLRDALAALPPQAQPSQIMNVARQLLQGHAFLRVRGDARELLAAGEGLPMAVATHNDEQYVLVYSSGLALQAAVRADGDSGTSAIAQPVPMLLQQVVDGPFAGIAIDQASTPASVILPTALLEKALAELDPDLTVKTLLAGPRTAETSIAVAAALTTAPLWIAARRGDDGQFGIAEVRTEDGERLLELFSHPLELVTLGRGDQPLKIAAEQLARALRGDEGLTGVVVDPAGPWIRLSRDELGPVIAIAG